MDEFRSALGRYLVGDLGVEGLEAAIDAALAASETAGPELDALLDELYASGRLSHQVFALLKKHLERRTQAAAPEAAPPGDDGDAEKTVFQVPGAGAPTTPTQPPAPAAEDDRTQIMPQRPPGAAAPTSPPTSPSVTSPPTAPTGAPTTPTGQTPPSGGVTGQGAVTGPAMTGPAMTGPAMTGSGTFGPATTGRSQTGAGTAGTGSNWSHPSQWTGPSGEGGPVPDIGTMIKNRFVLEEVLGQGGMGKVFKARDLRKEEAEDRNPYVAVKILNEDFKRHPQALQALQRESRKAQDLAHPNVVTVFDFDRDGDAVYMTMEALEGESLDKFNKRHSLRGLTFDDALPIIRGLADGLAYAHQHGVVHSDFKPANAYLTRSGVVKIFDFGIARAAKRKTDVEGEKTLFDAGELGALTPAYASPEMFEGEDPDPRDDIYALAVVAYELLAGKHPFEEGGKKKSAVDARDSGMKPPPVKGVSRQQFKAIARGMAFNREDRTESVEAFLEELVPKPVSLLAWGAGAAAALVVVGAAAILIPQYLDGRTVERLVDAIQNGPDTVITSSLDELARLRDTEPQLFRDVFVADTTQSDFVSYYTRRVREAWDPEQTRFDIASARALLDELKVYFPDSARVESLATSIGDDFNLTIANFKRDLDELLQAGTLIAEQGSPNATEVLSRIREMSPDDERLRLDDIPIRFAEVAGAALDNGDVALAGRIVDRGFDFNAENIALVNVRDRVTNELESARVAERIAALENRVRVAEMPAAQSALSALANDLTELEQLDAGNAVLAATRSLSEQTLGAELDALQADESFASARALLSSYAGIASEGFLNQRLETLEQLDAARTQRIDTLLAQLQEAVDGDQLEGPQGALARLAALEAEGASTVQLDRSRARIGQVYTDRANRAIEAQSWDDARTILEQGLALELSPSMQSRMERTLDSLTMLEQQAEGAAEEARQLLAQQQREQAIADHERAIEAALAGATITADAARAVELEIQGLRGFDVNVAPLEQQLEAKLAASVRELQARNDFTGALALVQQAEQILPGSSGLARLSGEVQADLDSSLAAARAQQVAQAAATLEQLIARAQPAQSQWTNDVQRALDEYASLAGESAPEVARQRDAIAQLYVNEAARLRDANRTDNAENQLRLATRFSPQLATIATERELLDARKNELEIERRGAIAEARIETQKQQLRAEATAGNMDVAVRLYEDLQAQVPDDAFVTRDAPNILAAGYVRLGERALGAGLLDQADQLLIRARAYAPDLAAVNDLEGAIQQQREADSTEGLQERLDQVQMAMEGDLSRDTGAIRNLVAAARAQDADAVADFVTELVGRLNALSQRQRSVQPSIAQQRQRDCELVFPNAGCVALEISTDPCASPALVGMGQQRRGRCRDKLSEGRNGPSLVVIPAGGPFSEPVAVSRFEITLSDYNNYCELSGACAPRPGTVALPLTNISIADAEAFVSWLNQESQASYRIPTAEEWDYAARANGAQPRRNFNCQVRQGGTLIKGMGLVGVTSGDPNGWGLVHYVGNAQEWVRSGSGLEVRGGAYTDNLTQCEIDKRSPHSGQPDAVTGFRVLRKIG